MFSGFTDETVQFFLDLKFHNSADYFHANHDRYVEAVQTPFYELIEALAPTMLSIDEGMEVRPHQCISRIHRDTRFSRDKSPYRDHLWFLFRRAAEPREKSLFYFFEFGPGRLDWGLGIWGENRELLDQFRRKLQANPDGMLARLDDMNLDFHRMFLGGSAFKRLPVPDNIPPRLKPWYCAKEMYIGKLIQDESIAYRSELVQELRADFLAVSPLYKILRGIQDQEGNSFSNHI